MTLLDAIIFLVAGYCLRLAQEMLPCNFKESEELDDESWSEN